VLLDRPGQALVGLASIRGVEDSPQVRRRGPLQLLPRDAHMGVLLQVELTALPARAGCPGTRSFPHPSC